MCSSEDGASKEFCFAVCRTILQYQHLQTMSEKRFTCRWAFLGLSAIAENFIADILLPREDRPNCPRAGGGLYDRVQRAGNIMAARTQGQRQTRSTSSNPSKKCWPRAISTLSIYLHHTHLNTYTYAPLWTTNEMSWSRSRRQ